MGGVCKTEIFTLCMLRNGSGVVDSALSGCHQDAKDTTVVLLLKKYIKYSNITPPTLQVSATTSSVKLIDDFEPEDDVRISFNSNGFLIIPLLLEST